MTTSVPAAPAALPAPSTHDLRPIRSYGTYNDHWKNRATGATDVSEMQIVRNETVPSIHVAGSFRAAIDAVRNDLSGRGSAGIFAAAGGGYDVQPIVGMQGMREYDIRLNRERNIDSPFVKIATSATAADPTMQAIVGTGIIRRWIDLREQPTANDKLLTVLSGR